MSSYWMALTMFNFLEEFAAIISQKELKCRNCGFVLDSREATEIQDTIKCPKCGENEWEETNLLEEHNL